MAARARTTLIGECSERIRNAEAELDAARTELKVALAEAGWREITSHYAPGAAPSIIYERDLPGSIDPISGMPSGDLQIRTFTSFVEGDA